LEDNIEDCFFCVGYLPSRDAFAQNVDDGVYITLLAIMEDVAVKNSFVDYRDINRNVSKQNPPIILELGVMVSAYFETYTESL
jgi:hypothetical protein